jgi:hypothetical protein
VLVGASGEELRESPDPSGSGSQRSQRHDAQRGRRHDLRCGDGDK